MAWSIFKKRDPEDITLEQQQQGLIEWASSEDMKPGRRKEIMRRISRMKRVLEGDEYVTFLEKLANIKLGFELTEDEVRDYMQFWNAAKDAEQALEHGGSKQDFNSALRALEDYTEKLKKDI